MTWFEDMCKEMEATHGERGWKRRLAEMLGVSDSNVQNWIRVGDAPPIVRAAYEAKERVLELEEELRALGNDNYVIEEMENGDSFRVLMLDNDTGRFIEQATTKSLGLAQAIIQIDSGVLDQKIAVLADRVADLVDDHPDDKAALHEVMNWNKSTRREEVAQLVSGFKNLLNPDKLEALQHDK
jgi:hypothetical protein